MAGAPRPSLALPWFVESETLFGWASRAQLLSGYSARRFSLELFGAVRAARSHVIPVGIPALVTATGGAIGSAERLVAERTPLAGRLPYLVPKIRAAVLQDLVAGQAWAALRKMGAAAYGLGSMPLRLCVHCAAEDCRDHGVALWHLAHQLDATWRCSKHDALLLEMPLSSPWQLPGPGSSRDAVAVARRNVPRTQRAALERSSAVTATATALEQIDVASLRQAAIRRLIDLRILKTPTNLPLDALTRSFRTSSIGRWLAANPSIVAPATSAGHLAELLKSGEGGATGRWSVLWSWLYDDEEASIAAAAFLEAATGQTHPTAPVQLDLWAAPGSVSMEEILRVVEGAIQHVGSIRELAERVGLSTYAASALMAENKTLKEQWAGRRHAERRDRAVGSLETVLAKNPSITRQELARCCRVDLHWLQRNELALARIILSRVPDLRTSQLRLRF